MTVAEAWVSTQPQRNPPPTKTVDNPLPSQRRRVQRLTNNNNREREGRFTFSESDVECDADITIT